MILQNYYFHMNFIKKRGIKNLIEKNIFKYDTLLLITN